MSRDITEADRERIATYLENSRRFRDPDDLVPNDSSDPEEAVEPGQHSSWTIRFASSLAEITNVLD